MSVCVGIISRHDDAWDVVRIEGGRLSRLTAFHANSTGLLLSSFSRPERRVTATERTVIENRSMFLIMRKFRGDNGGSMMSIGE